MRAGARPLTRLYPGSPEPAISNDWDGACTTTRASIRDFALP